LMTCKTVIWLGQEPDAALVKLAKARELTLSPNPTFATDQIDAKFAACHALVLNLENADALDNTIMRRVVKAQHHGAFVIATCPLEAVDALTAKFKANPEIDHVPIDALRDPLRFFSKIDNHKRGPAWKKINPKGEVKLNPEEKVLLGRAFNDCSKVELRRLDEGNSATVFQAFVQLAESRVGRRALPFLVKFDRRRKIQRELQNYRECVKPFVPFYAAPHLDDERSLLGAQCGVLVANFIEASRSLGDMIDEGLTQGLAASIFDDALRGWRRQAYHESRFKVTRSVVQSLGGAGFNNNTAQANRAENVAAKAKKFGATSSAAELSRRLCALPAVEHHCAIMHGDLHPLNIRVRNGQAVLIDFASVSDGPIVGDPAMLDAAIALRIKENNFPVWSSYVKKWFAYDSLLQLPDAPSPEDNHAATGEFLREIRRIGISDQRTYGEYATAVAVFLLRHAYRKEQGDDDQVRRAFLFSVAELIVDNLTKAEPPVHMES
jgi:thiamine kinase-like enzyme